MFRLYELIVWIVHLRDTSFLPRLFCIFCHQFLIYYLSVFFPWFSLSILLKQPPFLSIPKNVFKSNYSINISQHKIECWTDRVLVTFEEFAMGEWRRYEKKVMTSVIPGSSYQQVYTRRLISNLTLPSVFLYVFTKINDWEVIHLGKVISFTCFLLKILYGKCARLLVQSIEWGCCFRFRLFNCVPTINSLLAGRYS